jgi:hypothetical protein
VVLEVALLVTPYAQFFGIARTPTFVVVTQIAHAVFGVVMGLTVRALWKRSLARPVAHH